MPVPAGSSAGGARGGGRLGDDVRVGTNIRVRDETRDVHEAHSLASAAPASRDSRGFITPMASVVDDSAPAAANGAVGGEDKNLPPFTDVKVPEEARVRCFFSRNREHTAEPSTLRNSHVCKTNPDEYEFILTGRMFNFLRKHHNLVLAVQGIFDTPDTVLRMVLSLKEGQPLPPLRLMDALIRATLIDVRDEVKFRDTDDFYLIYYAIRGARRFFDNPRARRIIIRHHDVWSHAMRVSSHQLVFSKAFARENHVSRSYNDSVYGPSAAEWHLEVRIVKSKRPQTRSLKEWRDWAMWTYPSATHDRLDCRSLLDWKTACEVRNVWYEVLNYAGYPMGEDYYALLTPGKMDPLTKNLAVLVATDKLPQWPTTGLTGKEASDAEQAHPLSKAIAQDPISFATFIGMLTHVKILLGLKQAGYHDEVGRLDSTISLLLTGGFHWPLFQLARNIDEVEAKKARVREQEEKEKARGRTLDALAAFVNNNTVAMPTDDDDSSSDAAAAKKNATQQRP